MGLLFPPNKKLGQNFLVNKRIAVAEAEHAYGKGVLEIGPGYGILTEELAKRAKLVVAVEKDHFLYSFLSAKLKKPNVELVEGDFFSVNSALDLGRIDIVISNIPYNLSSKTIEWLAINRKEALLCMQKEFIEHMLAKSGSRKYSKLSVYTQLSFSMTKLMDVPKGNFRPIPKVDSALIYLKPKMEIPSKEELSLMGLLMQHKKKKLRNAVADSAKQLGLEKKEALELASRLKNSKEKVFKLSPDEILLAARELMLILDSKKSS
ncbi:MAG: 16S rRNA (adenine(1518)-N(6)/adenine(1519)-N(6))-dimethyltransferase RsmA [Candidatus Micrarchaeia archaeon]|jgi:16S rRNA (adenine1518-N6/adenine1519-N6)-dimethyltransferase